MTKIEDRFSKLASYGFSVFPVIARDKKPAVKWASYQTEMPTETDLINWDKSDFNVGVACGRLSNIVVLDIDSEEAQALYDTYDAPSTPTVRTSRGRHYYFRAPDVDLRNMTHVGKVALDVRGEGGYVVGPGSFIQAAYLTNGRFPRKIVHSLPCPRSY